MSTHRFRRIDRRTAEQQLSGAPSSGRPATPDALGELLEAAAGPAREGELSGEQAAVAAFHAARLDPVPEQRRLSMIKTALAGLLTAKILVPAAAAAAAGGITLAGVTGTLPIPDDAPAGPPAEVTTTPRTPESTPAGEAAVPAQGLVGLCQAYTSGATEQGKAAESPAFQQLATEAGGTDNVDAYCDDVLADRPGRPADVPSTSPSTPAHPTGKPAERPSGAPEDVPSTTAPAHPTGQPDGQPTAPDSPPDHPTDQPDDRPTTTPGHPTGAPENTPGR